MTHQQPEQIPLVIAGRGVAAKGDPAASAQDRVRQPVWKPGKGVDSSALPLLIEAGLANPDGTFTVEQMRFIMLIDLIIDFYLEWNER